MSIWFHFWCTTQPSAYLRTDYNIPYHHCYDMLFFLFFLSSFLCLILLVFASSCLIISCLCQCRVEHQKRNITPPVIVLFGFIFAGQLDCRYSRKFLSYRTKRFTRFYASVGRISWTSIIELKSKNVTEWPLNCECLNLIWCTHSAFGTYRQFFQPTKSYIDNLW